MEVFDASILVEDALPKSNRPTILAADGKEAKLDDENNNVVPVRVLGMGQGYYNPDNSTWMPLHYNINDILIVEDVAIHKCVYKGKDYWRVNAGNVLFRESTGGLV